MSRTVFRNGVAPTATSCPMTVGISEERRDSASDRRASGAPRGTGGEMGACRIESATRRGASGIRKLNCERNREVLRTRKQYAGTSRKRVDHQNEAGFGRHGQEAQMLLSAVHPAQLPLDCTNTVGLVANRQQKQNVFDRAAARSNDAPARRRAISEIFMVGRRSRLVNTVYRERSGMWQPISCIGSVPMHSPWLKQRVS